MKQTAISRLCTLSFSRSHTHPPTQPTHGIARTHSHIYTHQMHMCSLLQFVSPLINEDTSIQGVMHPPIHTVWKNQF